MYNVAIGEERGQKRKGVEPAKGEDEMTNDTQDSKAGTRLGNLLVLDQVNRSQKGPAKVADWHHGS